MTTWEEDRAAGHDHGGRPCLCRTWPCVYPPGHRGWTPEFRALQSYMRTLAFEIAWERVARTPCYHVDPRDHRPLPWCLQPMVNHARVVGLTGRRLNGHSFV